MPVYNVEKYLEESILSVINQTYKDLEILIINDGSTDNSIEICKTYEKMDNRIKFFDLPNGGVSVARNFGLAKATGEYVTFIDSDDFIALDMYEKMYTAMVKSNSDVIMAGIKNVTDSGELINLNPLTNTDTYFNKPEIPNNVIFEMISSEDLRIKQKTIMGSVCRLLFKKSIIDENRIKFVERLTLCEDFLFCLEVFFKCNKIGILKDCFYNYRQNNNSAVRKYRGNFEAVIKEVYLKTEEIIQSESNKNLFENRLNNLYLRLIFWNLQNETSPGNTQSIRVKLENIKTLCGDPKLVGIVSSKWASDITFEEKILLNLIKKKQALLILTLFGVKNKLA